MTLTLAEQHLKWRLHELLQENILEVTFTKSDGSKRTMRCTLQDEYFPFTDKEANVVKKKRETSPDVLVVWDLEKDDWRSFKIATVEDYRMIVRAKSMEDLIFELDRKRNRINLNRQSETHSDKLYFMSGQIEALDDVLLQLEEYLEDNS